MEEILKYKMKNFLKGIRLPKVMSGSSSTHNRNTPASPCVKRSASSNYYH